MYGQVLRLLHPLLPCDLSSSRRLVLLLSQAISSEKAAGAHMTISRACAKSHTRTKGNKERDSYWYYRQIEYKGEEKHFFGMKRLIEMD